MKIYVVTQGSYSDYHIEQVFLEREKAELYCKLHDTDMWGDHPEIEEFDTYDDFAEKEKDTIEYVYEFDLDREGSTHNRYCYVLTAEQKEEFEAEHWPLNNKLGLEYIWGYPDIDRLSGMIARIITRELNAEKAEKIVHDLLAEYAYSCAEKNVNPPWRDIRPYYMDLPSMTTATYIPRGE